MLELSKPVLNQALIGPSTTTTNFLSLRFHVVVSHCRRVARKDPCRRRNSSSYRIGLVRWTSLLTSSTRRHELFDIVTISLAQDERDIGQLFRDEG